MNRRLHIFCWITLSTIVVGTGATPLCVAESPNYEDDIKPLFRDHCLKCHNADEANADLDLSSFAATMRGGSSGKVVVAGRPESSQLFRAVSHLDGTEPMPPESDKITAKQIGIIRDWIQSGLIAGKGQKSQLRSVAIVVSDRNAVHSPMPRKLSGTPLANTIRPPLPHAIAISPGAPLLATSGHQQLLLYDLTPEQQLSCIGALPFPEGMIHSLQFSRNGMLLLAAGGRGGHSGRVVAFDVASGKRMGAWGEEVDVILTADISANHKHVAMGGPNKAVVVFDTVSGNQVYRLKKHTDWITALAFSPDGKFLASGDRSGGVHVWETDRGAIVYTLDEHKVQVTGLAWRGDGKVLASAAEDGNLILWDMSDGWPTKNISAHQKKSESRYTRTTGITDLAFSRDGRIATVGRDQRLRLFEADTNQVREQEMSALPIAVEFTASGDQFVTACFDGRLQLWSVDHSKVVAERVNGQPSD